MTADLHIHPLEHKYFFAMTEGFSKVILDDEDKQTIQRVVRWCCHDRRLDAIALTDHDMIQAGLYAAEYVEQEGLPIKIITGAECSVNDPKSGLEDGAIHLLCLGIEKLPKYGSRTPVEKLIHAVHDLGGYVILAHPIEYPQTFFRCCHLLDGYEYLNSDKPPFEEGRLKVVRSGLSVRAFENSDFHFYGEFPDVSSPALHCNHYRDDALRG